MHTSYAFLTFLLEWEERMIDLSSKTIRLSSRREEVQDSFSAEVGKGVLEAWRVWRGSRVC